MEDSKCSVGELTASECHKLTFSRRKGIENVNCLSEEDRELLHVRTEAKAEDLETICLHHQSVYLKKFESLKKNCRDPLKKHKGPVKKTLRPVTLQQSKDLLEKGIKLKPGEKLCSRCRQIIYSSDVDQQSDTAKKLRTIKLVRAEEGGPSTTNDDSDSVSFKGSSVAQSLVEPNSSALPVLWKNKNVLAESLPKSNESPGAQKEENTRGQDESAVDTPTALYADESITEGDQQLKPVSAWTYTGGCNQPQNQPTTLQTYPSKHTAVANTDFQQQQPNPNDNTTDVDQQQAAKAYCKKCLVTSNTGMQTDDVPRPYDNDEAEAALLQLRVDKLLLEMDKLKEERERITAERRNMTLRADIARLYLRLSLSQSQGQTTDFTLSQSILSTDSLSSCSVLKRYLSSFGTVSGNHRFSSGSGNKIDKPCVISDMNRPDSITNTALLESVTSASTISDTPVALPHTTHLLSKVKSKKLLPKNVLVATSAAVSQSSNIESFPEPYLVPHTPQLSVKSKSKNSSRTDVVAPGSGSVAEVYNVGGIPEPYLMSHTTHLSSKTKSSTSSSKEIMGAGSGAIAQVYSLGSMSESYAVPHHAQLSSKAKSKTVSSSDVVGSSVPTSGPSNFLLASALTKTSTSNIFLLPEVFMTPVSSKPAAVIQQDIFTETPNASTVSLRLQGTASPLQSGSGSICTKKTGSNVERFASDLLLRDPKIIGTSHCLQSNSGSSHTIKTDTTKEIIASGVCTGFPVILGSDISSVQCIATSESGNGNSSQVDSIAGKTVCSVISSGEESSMGVHSRPERTLSLHSDGEQEMQSINVPEEVKCELDITEEIGHVPKCSYSISSGGVFRHRSVDDDVVAKRRKMTEGDDI